MGVLPSRVFQTSAISSIRIRLPFSANQTGFTAPLENSAQTVIGSFLSTGINISIVNICSFVKRKKVSMKRSTKAIRTKGRGKAAFIYKKGNVVYMDIVTQKKYRQGSITGAGVDILPGPKTGDSRLSPPAEGHCRFCSQMRQKRVATSPVHGLMRLAWRFSGQTG
jgi:hypothetical protein